MCIHSTKDQLITNQEADFLCRNLATASMTFAISSTASDTSFPIPPYGIGTVFTIPHGIGCGVRVGGASPKQNRAGYRTHGCATCVMFPSAVKIRFPRVSTV